MRVQKRKGQGFVAAYRRLPTWGQIGLPILAVLVILGVIGAIVGEEETGDSDQTTGGPPETDHRAGGSR